MSATKKWVLGLVFAVCAVWWFIDEVVTAEDGPSRQDQGDCVSWAGPVC